MENLKVIPTGQALGAEIFGLDLTSPLSRSSINSLRQALLDYSLIFFRNQSLNEQNQVDFTRYFGKPVEHVRKQLERPIKEIFLISNIKKEGKAIGALSNDEIGFHSDLSYLPQPGTISTLYAVQLPKNRGATQWCNGYSSYEALDNSTKERIQGLKAVHRHSLEEQNPDKPATHPLACTHPETGRKTLYLGPHLTRYIVGVDKKESEQILEKLFNHISQPQFVWTHHWHLGDFVIWDNRCTMHRREGFSSLETRLLKRTQVFNNQTPY